MPVPPQKMSMTINSFVQNELIYVITKCPELQSGSESKSWHLPLARLSSLKEMAPMEE